MNSDTMDPIPPPPPAPPSAPPNGPASGFRNSPAAESANARPAAITWLAATGTALIFAALAYFTISNWGNIGQGTKFVILIGATVSALVAGAKLRHRLPVTATALAHLGALSIPIDASALAYKWHWPTLLIVQGVTGLIAIAVLERIVKTIVLDYARPIAMVVGASGIAASWHNRGGSFVATAPMLVAFIALLFAATNRERRSVYVAAVTAAFAPVAVVLIDATMRHNDFTTGRGVFRILGVVGANWGWSLATAFVSATSFAIIAIRDQRVEFGAAAFGAFAVNGIVAWTALPTNSQLRMLALPALALAVELIALTLRKDRLFRAPSATIALFGEVCAAIPTAVVSMGAILLVRLNNSGQTDADRNRAAIAMAFLAAAWVAAAVRSTGETDEGGLLMTRAALAAGAMIATLSYATHTHLQLATITTAMALGALLIARRNQVVQYTSLSVLTWSVVAARGNGWGLWFAAVTTVAAIALAMRDDEPNLSWFAIPAFGFLAIFGRHDAHFQNRPLSYIAQIAVLYSISAVGLAAAARVAQQWRHQMYTIAALAGGVSLGVAALHNTAQVGLALCVIGAGGIANGLISRTAAAAHAGGITLVYGLWFSFTQHHIQAIEAYLVPVAAQLLIGGYCMRRIAARKSRDADVVPAAYATHSWAAYGPGLITLLVPTIWAAITTSDAASGAHLLFAGAVAVIAVAIGGMKRLAAPIMLGTAALVVITGDLTAAPARHVPAWLWLAAGGCALVATAIGMERTETTPLAAGRRLVDVVHDHFE